MPASRCCGEYGLFYSAFIHSPSQQHSEYQCQYSGWVMFLLSHWCSVVHVVVRWCGSCQRGTGHIINIKRSWFQYNITGISIQFYSCVKDIWLSFYETVILFAAMLNPHPPPHIFSLHWCQLALIHDPRAVWSKSDGLISILSHTRQNSMSYYWLQRAKCRQPWGRNHPHGAGTRCTRNCATTVQPKIRTPRTRAFGVAVTICWHFKYRLFKGS